MRFAKFWSNKLGFFCSRKGLINSNLWSSKYSHSAGEIYSKFFCRYLFKSYNSNWKYIQNTVHLWKKGWNQESLGIWHSRSCKRFEVRIERYLILWTVKVIFEAWFWASNQSSINHQFFSYILPQAFSPELFLRDS